RFPEGLATSSLGRSLHHLTFFVDREVGTRRTGASPNWATPPRVFRIIHQEHPTEVSTGSVRAAPVGRNGPRCDVTADAFSFHPMVDPDGRGHQAVVLFDGHHLFR